MARSRMTVNRTVSTSKAVEQRDWRQNRAMWVHVLERRTGEGVSTWLRRIERARLKDAASLREWLNARGVTGYAQSLLVMERFGYPDFLRASATELINGQYADRPALRPVYDAVLSAALRAGEVAVQARKTYVSLVTPLRTFARIMPTTCTRVDVGLRLASRDLCGRLQRCRIHPTMPIQVGLTSPADVDAEVVSLLLEAYRENS